jgi:hypothetical protein
MSTAFGEFSADDWRLLQGMIAGAASGQKRRFLDSIREFDQQVEHRKRVFAWIGFVVLHVVVHRLGRNPTDEDLRSLGWEVDLGYRAMLAVNPPAAADVLLASFGRLPTTEDFPGSHFPAQQCALLGQLLIDPETDLLNIEGDLIEYWRAEGPDFEQELLPPALP